MYQGWQIIKFIRRYKMRDKRNVENVGSPCHRVCFGQTGHVALVWWFLTATLLLIVILGTIIFHLIYGQVYGLFSRFVATSLPIAQPVR